ncbi:FimV/HubP family polar landmark protein [Propionivibrio sp.]|uniref:FimV/HubP family polar landmark protein n=1 Tax=Propionivibrio sp. TaxID=2212460 RepID=UPI00272E8F27|nr:FimV/HubP family polar landmark protein [Propionivibrio sp.]
MANKTYQSNRYFRLSASAFAVASCLVLSSIPLSANAAGLGRLVVFSALGQPLRAEIEVTATQAELIDMKARLAPQELFKQAGLDYATTLLSINFNLEKRPNGKAVIKLSSSRPINDPFVDMLMELNWSSGRLVREYSFLLDPPEYKVKAATVPVTTPSVAAVPKRSSSPASAASRIDSDVRARAVAQLGVAPKSTPKAGEQPSVAGSREVRNGETLHRIATEVKPQGVTLDQMLVALFQANPDAFDGNNMNRLKAGKILSLPEKSAVEALPPAEARKVVLTQSSNWNAYRSKLAGISAASPAKSDSTRQEVGGKITAKVEDKEEQVVPKDQLKVSRADSKSGKGGAPGTAAEEESIAKDKALQEANERVAALEKNVADLQKLLELKNQSLADLQKQTAPAPAPAGSASPETPASAPVASPAQATPPAAGSADLAAAAKTEQVEAKPQEPPAAPAQVAEKVSEPKPAAQKPAATPKATTPPPPPEEPGFFASLLADPMTLAGGGGVLALLAALLFARRKRASKNAAEADLSSTLTPPTTASLSANSVFRTTGGQSVDTASQTPAQTDFSQAGPGSIDTDEVDPVAEADVYMAYGRDAQAEEILLEAKQKDPKRLAIHLKLLEIYSGRKDLARFETLAADLYGETNGIGPEWDKAVSMGRQLDPANPMFRGDKTPSGVGAVGAAVAMVGGASEEIKDARVMPEALFQPVKETESSRTETVPEPAIDAPVESTETKGLDFDLGNDDGKPAEREASVDASSDTLDALDFDLGSIEPEVPAEPAVPEFSLPDASSSEIKETATGMKADAVPDLDFDIGTQITPAEEVLGEEGRVSAKESLPGLDFDFDLSPVKQETPAEEVVSAGGGGLDDVEFDVNLTESTFLGREEPEPSSFDLSEIDLDLQSPDLEIPSGQSDIDQAEPAHVSTAVNTDFSLEQAETLIVPGGQSQTVLNPDFSGPEAEETLIAPSLEGGAGLAPDLEIGANEEVATKLDLAKAYEEMGDLEGARELLQEVLKEGDVAQREAAQSLLDRIGG